MERPDEKTVITYVAMIFRALAKFIKSDALVKSIKKARALQYCAPALLAAVPACQLFTTTSFSTVVVFAVRTCLHLGCTVDVSCEHRV